MPKIDFYILTDTGRLPFICRLIEKAHQQKHNIFIHTRSAQESTQLDQLLWTYRDDSFIPHNLYEELSQPAPPIQISHQATPEDHRDILINLSDDVPGFYSQFARILEVISNDTEQQTKARDRFRFYREHHCDLTTHKI